MTLAAQPDLLRVNMAWLLYILLCLIWGSTWLTIKIGLEDSPPLWSASFRFIIASAIVVLINLIRKARYPRSGAELAKIAVPGIFMYGLSYMLVYVAESYISSSLTAVLFASLPFFVAGFSVFMLKQERLSGYGWAGLLVGFLGIVVIFYDSLTKSEFQFLGAALAVAGAVASAYATVDIRRRFTSYDIFTATAIQMTLGAVMITIAAALFEPIGNFHVTAKSMSALFYLAILGTVVAFLGYYWLLQRMKAITVSQIGFVIPIVAVVLGNIFKSETLTLYTAVGTVMILGGVLLVVRG